VQSFAAFVILALEAICQNTIYGRCTELKTQAVRIAIYTTV
jgi:hypothetical protein